ncbi:MAG: Fic family protein [Vicingaceae bacterium]|nr:Fic family protein [Vicingaceae bacterium]
MIKNHPFNDGNKRSGAFSFIWLLQKAKYSFQEKINSGNTLPTPVSITTANANMEE